MQIEKLREGMHSKIVLLILSCFIFSCGLPAQCIRMVTWNLQDLGRTKGANEIEIIARTLKDFDFVAIQEVVAKDPAGAQKVAEITDLLNRMGDKWDYTVSDPTTDLEPNSRERYAFLWKTSKVTIIRALLDEDNENNIVREPYLAKLNLKSSGKEVWVANFHSLPYSKHPETEIALLSTYFPAAGTVPLVLMGDWNVNERDPVWDSFLSFGIQPVVRGAGTTLKRVCKNNTYVNHQIDNIYFPAKQCGVNASGVLDIVDDCANLNTIRRVSDHLPVWGEICF